MQSLKHSPHPSLRYAQNNVIRDAERLLHITFTNTFGHPPSYRSSMNVSHLSWKQAICHHSRLFLTRAAIHSTAKKNLKYIDVSLSDVFIGFQERISFIACISILGSFLSCYRLWCICYLRVSQWKHKSSSAFNVYLDYLQCKNVLLVMLSER